MEKVQVIDISPFTKPSEHDDDAREKVLKAWNTSFSSLGFAIIIGHGVPQADISTMQSVSRVFFELSSEEKMKSCLHAGYGKGGYVPMGVESVAMSVDKSKKKPPDYVESLYFFEGGQGNDVKVPFPKDLNNTVYRYWKSMRGLLSLSMEISALSLGLPRDFFAPHYTEPECTLRSAYYPPLNDRKLEADQMRYGAHTDYTGFTFLRPDPEVGGLEVSDPKTSAWIPVNPKGDCFIVNVGDLIHKWTNDQWISNLHRVVNPAPEVSHKSRLSIVCFTGPNEDAVIAPLEVCCGTDNPPKYKAVTAGEHLRMKISASNL